jgi:tetratricopeptide (TPR) repeat protein
MRRRYGIRSALLLLGLALQTHVLAADERGCYAPESAGGQSIERACSDVIAMLGAAPALEAAERRALTAAYNNRAITRIRVGELELAAEDLGQALLLQPDAWALYLNRGNLRLAQGDYGAALADYQQAAQRSPQAADLARRNAVLAYRGLGDLGAAEAALATLLAREMPAER